VKYEICGVQSTIYIIVTIYKIISQGHQREILYYAATKPGFRAGHLI